LKAPCASTGRSTTASSAQLQGPEFGGEASADGLHVARDRPHRQPFTDQLVDWLERGLGEPAHQRWLAERWRRMRGQIGDPAYPSAIAPQQIEFLVPFCDVFPWDFDITVAHDATKLLAIDTYCMNPGCRCDEVVVQFFDTLAVGATIPGIGHVKASVRRVRTPTVEGPAVLHELWDELLDQVGADRLRDPFQRMRPVGKGRTAAPSRTPARNAPCPCASGKKYKRCCGRYNHPIAGRRATPRS
jgi:hypothetical protein